MHDKLSKQVLVDIFDLISRIYTNYLTSNLAAFAIQIDKQLQSEEGMSLRIIKFFMAIKATNFNIYAPLQEKSMLIDLQLKFRKDELLHKSNLAE